MSVEAEFSFEPQGFLALDAVYLVRPELRGRMAAVLALSGISMFAAVATAVAGGHPALWVSCLGFTAVMLGLLAWWSFGQTRGSVFAAGPGSVYADDYGLLVRGGSGQTELLSWSTLRGWGEAATVLVLFPDNRGGRPLHVIPVADLDRSEDAARFRELLRWHLGKPRG